jgi:hypothetical protein
MVGNKWKKRSKMSIGLVNVPFFSMINFSITCGIGLNGARSMKTAITTRIEYGILSRIANMIIHRKLK